MPSALHQALEGPARALKLRALRSQVLAHNIANADTPGFKARDFHFADALKAGGSGAPAASTLKRTHAAHLTGTLGAIGAQVELGYRQPLQPSLDQNTVETHVEQAAFTDNAIRYQATLTLLDRRVRGLLTAISGQ